MGWCAVKCAVQLIHAHTPASAMASNASYINQRRCRYGLLAGAFGLSRPELYHLARSGLQQVFEADEEVGVEGGRGGKHASRTGAEHPRARCQEVFDVATGRGGFCAHDTRQWRAPRCFSLTTLPCTAYLQVLKRLKARFEAFATLHELGASWV